MDRSAWDERHREAGHFSDPEPNRLLVGAVQGLTPGTALDLAAGQGRNAVWLASRGWRVTALDWSGVALEKAAALAVERGVDITCERADLLKWHPGGRYDLVAVVYLQLPSPDRHEVWRKAARSVSPGGRLVMVGHDTRNLEEGYGGPSHESVLYTAAEASEVLEDLLVVERAGTVVRPVETEEGTRHAIDNLVVARA